MLKLSLKEGQYVNIGDDIRIVFAGGIGKHCRLLIDAPKELNIARSNNEPDPAKRKDTYYPDPEISNEAQKEIQRIDRISEAISKVSSQRSSLGKLLLGNFSLCPYSLKIINYFHSITSFIIIH